MERPPENPAAFWFIVSRSSLVVMDARCCASAFKREKPQAGTGFPGGSPYHVEVRDATKNQRNGVVKKSVPVPVLSNIRPQQRRGAPQARPSRPDSLQIQNRVGIRDATKNQRNGVVKKSVPVIIVSNIRPQRRTGAPQARPSRPPFFIRSQEPARRVPSCR